jgi:UDP-GlcNAc3NAcA epimerase
MPSIKILTVVGARPQIIKAAALSRAIRTGFSNRIQEIILHTGQHYDTNMSQVFFDELGIPHPDINLNIGSASHGRQTAKMIQGIEAELEHHRPDYLVLFGDTNSTLAGAVAGAKLRIPIVHIEAGLRSFNKSMPEEINRVMCDHASTLLFVPTPAGIRNLKNEGLIVNRKAPYTIDNPGIFHCGDIMFDNLVLFSDTVENNTEILQRLSLVEKEFILCTIHRDNNTDDPVRLASIFSAMLSLAEAYKKKVVIPLHPRTAKMLPSQLSPQLLSTIKGNRDIHIIPPVSYMEMVLLEKKCDMILTDSGGVQKEAYFFKKPLIIARPETEWSEIVENGTGIITDADENRIIEAYNKFKTSALTFPPVFGEGNAGEFICQTMLGNVAG